ncbi:uncharacterized protein LOC143040401 [Oratosquilla oratoria]|uniref:uncharacterized protein LOC143040401 n=1 Tax=Oratosquilla oratoria TaxID=337810 RepID=UPI003F7606CC
MRRSKYSIQDHDYDEGDCDSDCSFETAYSSAQPQSRLGFDREDHGKRSLYRTEQDGRQIGYDEEQGTQLKSRHHHLGFSNERLERGTHKERVDHREQKQESGYDGERVTGTHYNARSQNRNRPNTGSNTNDKDTEEMSHEEISDVGSDWSSPHGSDLENRGTPDVRTGYRGRPNGRMYNAERPALGSSRQETFGKRSLSRERLRSELRSPGYSRGDPRLQREETGVEYDGRQSGLEQDIADLNLREQHNSKSNCSKRPGLMSSSHSGVESEDDMDCRENHDIKLSNYRRRGGKVSEHGEELDSSADRRERGASDMDRRCNSKSSYRDRNDEVSDHGDEFDTRSGSIRSDLRQAYGEKDAPHMDKRGKYKKSSYTNRNDEMSGHSDDFDSRSNCSRSRDVRQYRKDASDMDKNEKCKSGYKNRNDNISGCGDNSDVRSSGSRRSDSRPDFKDKDVSNIDYRGKHEKSNYRHRSDGMSDDDDFDSRSNCSRGYDSQLERDASDQSHRGKHDKKLINRDRSERLSDSGDDIDSRSNCSRSRDLRQNRKDASDVDKNEKCKSGYKNRNDNISGRGDNSDVRSSGSRRPDSRPDFKDKDVSNIDYRGKHEKSNYRDRSDGMSDDDDFDSRSNRSRGYDSQLERDASDLGHRGKHDKKLDNRDRSERLSDSADDIDSRSNSSRRRDLRQDYRKSALDMEQNEEHKSGYKNRNDNTSGRRDNSDVRSSGSRRSDSRPDFKDKGVSNIDYKGKHEKSRYRDGSDRMSDGDDFDSKSNCSRGYDKRFERDASDLGHRGKHDKKLINRDRSERLSDNGDDFDSRSNCSRRSGSRSDYIERNVSELDPIGKRDKKLNSRDRRDGISTHGDDFDSRSTCSVRSDPRFDNKERGPPGIDCRGKHDMESTYRGRSERMPEYGDDSEKRVERDGRRRHGSSDCHRGSELRSDYGSETDARLNYQRRPDSEPPFRGRGPEERAAEVRERHDKPDRQRPSSSSSYRDKYDKESGSRRVDAGDYREDPKSHGKERLESRRTSLGDGERQNLTRHPPVTQRNASERETLRSRDMDEYGPLLDSREIPGREFVNRERPGYKRPNKESDFVRYDPERDYRYMPDPDYRRVDTGIGHMEKWNTMSNDQVNFPQAYYKVRPDTESDYRFQSPNYRTSHQQGDFERQPDNLQNVHKNKPKISEKQIISNIIKELAKFQGQWSTVVSLSRLVQRSRLEIEQVVMKNSEIFGQMVNQRGDDVMVELCPKLSLCDNFIHFTGCKDSEKCLKLHMCKFFILETCGKGAICSYGHRWKTGHNLKVLERFHIQDVDPNILQELLKKTTQNNLVPKICQYYNGQGCRKGDTECSCLHICHAYVYTGQKCRDKCPLNHDIFANHCVTLLNKYGISINESPRHILQKLNPGPPQYKASRKFVKPHLATSWRKKVNFDKNRDESSTSEDTSDEEEDSHEDSKHDKRNKSGKGNKSKQKKKTNVGAGERAKKGTRYCNDLCGDVVVPEICKFNLSGKCYKEDSGCLRLHSKNKFHWQVELNGSWYNLRDFQCYILETACVDANEDGVVLQYHDTKNKDTLTKALYSVLGTSDLHVDFETMTMKSQLNVNMRLRRLTSSSSTGSHLYQWFFYDDKKWIKYGAVDSHGRTDLVSSLTSDDIEQNYLKDMNQIVKFKNQQFQYEINFQTMKQKNLATKKERCIRRRPKRT